MTDFKYSQIVSAANLNNVAIDLGDAQFDHFSDSVPYAVDQLNAITGDLVTAGVLNILNNCAVTVSANGININTGVAVFGDGAKIRITEPLSLPYSAGELFFYKDPTTKEVTAEVGTLPQDNYVWLATVQNESTFIDRRTFAKAKVTLLTEGNSFLKTLEVPTFSDYQNLPSNPLLIPSDGTNKIIFETFSSYNNNWILRSLYLFDPSNLSFNGFYGYSANYKVQDGLTVYFMKYSGTPYYDLSATATTESGNLVFNFSISSSTGGGGYQPLKINAYIYGGI